MAQSSLHIGVFKDPLDTHLPFFWYRQAIYFDLNWLVVSTHLKKISQIGHLPQIGVNKKKMKPQPS